MDPRDCQYFNQQNTVTRFLKELSLFQLLLYGYIKLAYTMLKFRCLMAVYNRLNPSLITIMRIEEQSYTCQPALSLYKGSGYMVFCSYGSCCDLYSSIFHASITFSIFRLCDLRPKTLVLAGLSKLNNVKIRLLIYVI